MHHTNLLTARQVQEMLDVDRSTVYRMAGDGRLPAVRIGKQWRFPATEIERMFDGVFEAPEFDDGIIDCEAAEAVLDLAAPLLGVMMVVTDLSGIPLTKIVNPTPWMSERLDEPETLTSCLDEWHELAADLDLAPRFVEGGLGFECARSFIRHGAELVGMVLAGGVTTEDRSDLYRLDEKSRGRVLSTLPRVGALLSRCATKPERSTK